MFISNGGSSLINTSIDNNNNNNNNNKDIEKQKETHSGNQNLNFSIWLIFPNIHANILKGLNLLETEDTDR